MRETIFQGRKERRMWMKAQAKLQLRKRGLFLSAGVGRKHLAWGKCNESEHTSNVNIWSCFAFLLRMKYMQVVCMMILNIKWETKLQSISHQLLTFSEWHTVLSALIYAHASHETYWVGESVGQGSLLVAIRGTIRVEVLIYPHFPLLGQGQDGQFIATKPPEVGSNSSLILLPSSECHGVPPKGAGQQHHLGDSGLSVKS